MTLAIVRAPLAVLYVEPLHIVERVDFTERHDLLWAMLRRQTCDRLEWTEADFARLTAAICEVAAECCSGRVVSTLEGGYDLPALAASVAAHVGELARNAR